MRNETYINDCCGLGGINDFGWDDPGGSKMTAVHISRMSESLVQNIVGLWATRVAIIQATLNEDQVRAGVGKVLKAAGFKAQRSIINPNSGSRITLYLLRRPDDV